MQKLQRCANTLEHEPRSEPLTDVTIQQFLRGVDGEENSSEATTQDKGGSTRHIRCDYEFLGLLNEDFGIDLYSLNKAFMGVPSAPKKQAIALCEWAVRAGGYDADEAGRALRAWARRRGAGLYSSRMVDRGPAAAAEV
jgi:hypothetical protein